MNKSRVIDKEKLLRYSAVLSILVVLIHSENIWAYGLGPDTMGFGKVVYLFERFVSGNLAKIGVPSFFMISGVLFYRDFDMKKYPKKMKNRFFSLAIPYLLWNLLRFLLFYVFSKIPATRSFLGMSEMVLTPKILLESVFFYKYNLGYWFMYQLILYTLLCPVIYALLKKKPIAYLSLIAVFVLFSTDALGELAMTVFQKKFLQIDGLFYYMFGGFIGMHYFDVVNKKSKRLTLLAGLGFLLGQVFFALFHTSQQLVFHILFCFVSAISFWYLFDGTGTKHLTPKITTITFFIYSAHGTVLELSQALVAAFFPNTPFVALMEYLLLPITTLTILVLVSLFMKRYLGGIWRLLNGSR